jgi:hypothetical protein
MVLAPKEERMFSIIPLCAQKVIRPLLSIPKIIFDMTSALEMEEISSTLSRNLTQVGQNIRCCLTSKTRYVKRTFNSMKIIMHESKKKKKRRSSNGSKVNVQNEKNSSIRKLIAFCKGYILQRVARYNLSTCPSMTNAKKSNC